MKYDSKQLKEMSNTMRCGALRALVASNSGHLGIALGASDIVTTLYANHFNKTSDKFVLSAGHGSALLYSVLKLTGHNIAELESFRKIGGLPGHPEYGIDGVSATTGPLGQGVGNAVGMAMARKIAKSRNIINNEGFIYCLCSDGDLMEGVANESIAFAGRYKLNNLILLWDDNGISIDGTALTDIDIPARVAAAGFEILSVNGNDFNEINYALEISKKSAKPVFIQCKTIVGFGSSVAGSAAAHGLSVSNLELQELQKKFESKTGEILWFEVANNLNSQPIESIVFNSEIVIPNDINSVSETDSTRNLSGKFLGQLISGNPMILGGSADLSESTNARVLGHKDIKSDDFSGNFINYGVREHAMAAIMNGLSLSGFRPYGGTFLIFSDYMRPAIRLAAIMKQPVIYVFSHDSIAIGEDGPTHEPVEQLASLRLIPNLNVFRPCNMAEIAASWSFALNEKNAPTAIILSRQKFEQVKTPSTDEILLGGYVIYKSESKTRITLIATGAEVPIAINVAKKIKGASVVSIPCVEIFRSQSLEYKKSILAGRVIAIEAGATSTWYEFADAVIGIDEFGLSGNGLDVYKHFGFDAENIGEEIVKNIK